MLFRMVARGAESCCADGLRIGSQIPRKLIKCLWARSPNGRRSSKQHRRESRTDGWNQSLVALSGAIEQEGFNSLRLDASLRHQVLPQRDSGGHFLARL